MFVEKRMDDMCRRKSSVGKIWVGAVGLAIGLICLLTGCGQLMKEDKVRSGIQSMFPDASVTGMEESTDEEGYTTRVYYVTNRDVSFTFENYQYRDSLFGFTAASENNNYAEKLAERFRPELEQIFEEHGVTGPDNFFTRVTFTNEIGRLSDVDRGVLALQDVCELLADYIPNQPADWFDFQIALYTDYGKTMTTTVSDRSAAVDYDYEKALLYLNLADGIRRGTITDVVYTMTELSAIPVKTVERLYINGEQYTSQRYPTEFVYNLEDGQYYTRVCFGTQLDYNGGVEDYLQWEIIDAYYPDCEYTIEDDTSTYRLGRTRYSVKRSRDGLTFRKNGWKLDINAYETLNRESPGASYYYWISAEDFAELLGMQLEKTDASGIYLVQ